MTRCPNCKAYISIKQKLFFNQIALLECKGCGATLGHSHRANVFGGVLIAAVLVTLAGIVAAPLNGYVQLSAVISALCLLSYKYSARLYIVNELGVRKNV